MKRIIISLLAVLLSIVTFSTVAYAWLSLATSNTLENMKITFDNDEQLELSLDGINYFSTLDGKLIEEKLAKHRLIDLSSQDGKVFASHYSGLGGSIVKNRDYLEIDIYFRMTSFAFREIYLVNHNKDSHYNIENQGTYIVSQGKRWESPVRFLNGSNNQYVEEKQVGTYYLSEAMRIAFNEQKIDASDERTSLQSKIFDLSKNPTRGFGAPYGAYSYYQEINHEIPLPTKIPTVVTQLSEIGSTGSANHENSKILTLQERGIAEDGITPILYGKVRMTIWIEGWDADAFDAVLNDRVKIGLEFKAAVPTY